MEQPSVIDVIKFAFVASIITGWDDDELQLVYPDVKAILVDGRSVLPTVKAFHKAVTELL